jgi:hypothetical protein
VWRYLSNFRKNKETLTNGRGRREEEEEEEEARMQIF